MEGSERRIEGLHHVTALARDPQANLDFYTGVLGLRLVKTTVNFDDPTTYHLYYGDETGSPGTILTFFPWPLARRGSRGAGQATAVAFSIPGAAVGFWQDRLARHGVASEPPRPRFGDEEVIALLDPDGLAVELVAHAAAGARLPWSGGPVPAEHALRGLAAVTMTEWNVGMTAEFLSGTVGFRQVAEEGGRLRFAVGDGGAGTHLDLLAQPDASRGRISAGTIHHVAWRVAGDEAQRAWHEELERRGVHVSPIMDRQYFHSIYFREPGGVLLEIATDPPGFAIDEPVSGLGGELRLPPWLEPERAGIAAALPPLERRAAVVSAAGSGA